MVPGLAAPVAAMLAAPVAAMLAARHERILITGGGGWLGLATLELLAQALGDEFESRVACFGSARRDLVLRGGRIVPQQPLGELSCLSQMPTWVLHFAFLTKDRAEHMAEADYRAANEAIGAAVLNALDQIGAKAVFVASSGAAGRAHDPAATQAMRLYGELKLADEARFFAWSQARDACVVIGRLFALTGPYINKHDAYAIASFILDGLAARTITVRAPRRSVRAYVAIRELMSLVFSILAENRAGVLRFDTGGIPNELEDVARAVSRQCPGTHVERAPIVLPSADIYHGDCEAYAALLARYGLEPVSLDQQVAELIDFLRTQK